MSSNTQVNICSKYTQNIEPSIFQVVYAVYSGTFHVHQDVNDLSHNCWMKKEYLGQQLKGVNR